MLLHLGIALIALSTSFAASPAPNIVFFLVDDLGWNDVSFHGSPQIPTPTMDRLAKSGIALNQYYVNPVCSPTRASLMTGRSAMHTGIQTPYSSGDDASGLNLTYTLLPEQLNRQFNYTSYMVGKWYVTLSSRVFKGCVVLNFFLFSASASSVHVRCTMIPGSIQCGY